VGIGELPGRSEVRAPPKPLTAEPLASLAGQGELRDALLARNAARAHPLGLWGALAAPLVPGRARDVGRPCAQPPQAQ
jgi:hypothetical protein